MKKALLLLSASLLCHSALHAATTINQCEFHRRWYEYFSDVYAQIDKEPDGFYLISTNGPVGGGADVFPNEGNWLNVGSLTLSGTVTGVGVETFTITGSTFDFDQYVADNDMVAGVGYATNIGTPALGTIQFANGVVSSIDYSSPITFVFNGVGSMPFSGTLAINNSGFDLYADSTYPSGMGSPFRYVWDATGTAAYSSVVAVPEPTRSLFLLGSLGALLLRRRRFAVRLPELG